MDENLYQVSLEILSEAGVPQDVAEKASQVIANDDATLPNLGRTPDDQHAVNQAMVHYWANFPDPVEVTE